MPMKDVAFSEVTTTPILSRVNTATPPSTAVLVGVFGGERRTGGHAIQTIRIERVSDQLSSTRRSQHLPPMASSRR